MKVVWIFMIFLDRDCNMFFISNSSASPANIDVGNLGYYRGLYLLYYVVLSEVRP